MCPCSTVSSITSSWATSMGISRCARPVEITQAFIFSGHHSSVSSYLWAATQQARTGILWPYVEFYNQGHTTVRSLLLLMHSLYSKFWDNQVIFIYILPNFYKHFLNLFLRLMVFLHYHGTVIAQILTSTCSIGGGIFLNSHAEPNTLCVVRLHFDGAGTWEKMHPVSVLLL